MIFKETSLKGAFLVEIKKLEDNRGFFGRHREHSAPYQSPSSLYRNTHDRGNRFRGNEKCGDFMV